MKKLGVIEKLKILLFIKVIIGCITTIFFDLIIGIIILIAAGITLFWIIKTIFKKESGITDILMPKEKA